MCGITGVIGSGPLNALDIEGVRRANGLLAHRGPDGQGEFRSPDSHLFMAMRRLAIIDLKGGQQPLFNEDRSIALVANGEIYNFVELRQRLQSKHRFQTMSDCEVIIHAYEEYGCSFVEHLRGMFAFALWDGNTKRLILARDRMGEKPLYVHHSSKGLLFASEMKAIRGALDDGAAKISPEALDLYLHYGWVPEPETLIEGVSKLRPGHLLVVETSPFRTRDVRYWRLEDAPPIAGEPGPVLRSELELIAKQTLRSDVPVGIALSGGLDSSIIAALAKQCGGGPFQAFTVGYEGRPRQDERHLARELAQHLGLELHEVELSLPEFIENFASLPAKADDPIADIAGFAYWMLSRSAQEHGCPVLLQGQGGDELFWGYPWMVDGVQATERQRQGRPWQSTETLLRQCAAGPNRRRIIQLVNILGGTFEGWKRLAPDPRQDLQLYQLTDGYQMAACGAFATYGAAVKQRIEQRTADTALMGEADIDDVAVRVMGAVCRGYLLQNGLAQGDRLSMANSVELRAPLCDYRLAELAVGLQKASPSHLLPAKQRLKEAAKGLLPSAILERPKRGFNPPVTQWLRGLFHRYGAELENGLLVEHGILDADAASRLVRPRWRFSAERELGFRYLVLEFWARALRLRV